MEKQIFELEQKLKNAEKLKQNIEAQLKTFAPDKTIEELEAEYANLNEEELLAKINELSKKIEVLETQLQI